MRILTDTLIVAISDAHVTTHVHAAVAGMAVKCTPLARRIGRQAAATWAAFRTRIGR